MARYTRPVYNTSDVFSAACAAHRVNGAYIKHDEITFLENGDTHIDRIANKTLTHKFLKGEFDIRDEDREQAEKVMNFCRGLTFKLLSDKRLSEFEINMLAIVEKETTDSNYEIAIVSSLPASYERSIVRTEQDIRLREAGGCIQAPVDSKIEIDVEVVRCNYSNEWNIFYVTAIADAGVVYFAQKNKIDVDSKIRIKGKVKRHREDRTQLSHVKVF